ncbi:tRNA uridine 5-carboxymethylaminomethyl modification enzyme MnmG-related [Trema orientale]|uniref:tRNA uridine 5-carboxymethylaminomethyl modification enzyme MnmG-related n=1 Tax=Trema orientale TaxID=63057 RepID=A0A2P5B529_TREOI|nr:tRNA uridine 5-carboxymethylaminomethyl modification enzyme MnmG-related [Trema orientale]
MGMSKGRMTGMRMIMERLVRKSRAWRRMESLKKMGRKSDGTLDEKYRVIVVGGGHVGCGAALPSARMGKKLFFSR